MSTGNGNSGYLNQRQALEALVSDVPNIIAAVNGLGALVSDIRLTLDALAVAFQRATDPNSIPGAGAQYVAGIKAEIVACGEVAAALQWLRREVEVSAKQRVALGLGH